MRRADSSHCKEIRAMKEECEEFWWTREELPYNRMLLKCLVQGIVLH